MKKIFNNVLICDSQNNMKSVHLIVEKGIIKDIYEANEPKLMIDTSIEIIDANGLILIPAGVDTHVHLNDPGFTNMETYSTGTQAAIRGGIATVIDMPCTSIPPVVDINGFTKRIRAIKGNAYCDVALRGGVSEQCFNSIIGKNMIALKNEGVCSFKVYLTSGMKTFGQLNPKQLKEVLKIAKSLDMLVDCHCEDPDIISNLTEKYKDSTDILAYAKSRPVEAEVKGIETFLRLLKRTGAKGHIVHLGSKDGAALIKKYKEDGVDVTVETCPHYLAFNQEDFYKYHSALKTAPVVKSKEDSEALWKYLADGTIDFVATDHAPCPKEMKNTGSIWTDYGGISGLETFMDYMYNEGVLKNRITMERFIEITSFKSAKRYKLKKLGKIELGYYANFVMIDPKKERIVKGDNFYSKGKITPFEGMVFKSSIVKTYLRGEEVWSAEKGIINQPKGKFIKTS